MNKILAMVALLIALSACHAGIGIGDSGEYPANRASDGLGSAVAQASVGSAVTTDN